MNDEQPGCSFVSINTENMSEANEKSEAHCSAQVMCVSTDAVQVGGLEISLADDLDGLSYRTDNSVRDEQQGSDVTETGGKGLLLPHCRCVDRLRIFTPPFTLLIT